MMICTLDLKFVLFWIFKKAQKASRYFCLRVRMKNVLYVWPRCYCLHTRQTQSSEFNYTHPPLLQISWEEFSLCSAFCHILICSWMEQQRCSQIFRKHLHLRPSSNQAPSTCVVLRPDRFHMGCYGSSAYAGHRFITNLFLLYRNIREPVEILQVLYIWPMKRRHGTAPRFHAQLPRCGVTKIFASSCWKMIVLRWGAGRCSLRNAVRRTILSTMSQT